MTDYRNPDDPFYHSGNDPLRHDLGADPNVRGMNATWGWIAGIVFVAVILAVIFGVGHRPGATNLNTASNDTTPPAAIHMAPPAGTPAAPAPPAATPTTPNATPAPITPTPAPLPK